MITTVTTAAWSWAIIIGGPAPGVPTTTVGRSERIPSAASVRWYPIFAIPATVSSGYVALVSTPTRLFPRPSVITVSATSPFNAMMRPTFRTTTGFPSLSTMRRTPS